MSNLLAKTRALKLRIFLIRLKRSLTAPRPIFQKLSKCSHSALLRLAQFGLFLVTGVLALQGNLNKTLVRP